MNSAAKRNTAIILSGMAGAMAAHPTAAQNLPWSEFQDQITGIECGVINAANLEIVALRSSGQLVAVGQGGDDIVDFILPGVFVDIGQTDPAGGFPVFADGEFAGIVAFEEDAEGVIALWWGDAETIEDPLRIAEYDLDTDAIIFTNDTPANFAGAPCDACDLWDDPDACVAPPTINPPRVTINFCGAGGAATMALTFATLMGASIARRRRSG